MTKWLILRPTFEIPIAVTRELAMERLEQHCRSVAEPKRFFVHGEYGELHLPPAEHRLWSPHLSFYVTSKGEATRICGRFAPRLEIWTLVWVLYLAMAFTAFFSFIMAYSQWAIGEATWWHWTGLMATLAITTIYMVAHLGQQWSADQMQELREWLEQILCNAGLQQSNA
ncbi:MAG: hypothetical protein KF752_11040 [Pirellulaceae bacterium]|nr:hypothetical protein [Pirellulaceae bacterium]